MKYVSYIVIIISILFIIGLYTLLNKYLDTNLHYLNFFLLIPLGSIAIGAVISGPFFLTRKLLKQKTHDFFFLVIIIISILSFFIIDYNYYNDLYITKKGATTITGTNKDVEKLSDNISYFKYLDITHSSGTLEIKRYYAVKLIEFEVERITLIFITIVQLIGTFVGSMFLAGIIVGKKEKSIL